MVNVARNRVRILFW